MHDEPEGCSVRSSPSLQYRRIEESLTTRLLRRVQSYLDSSPALFPFMLAFSLLLPSSFPFQGLVHRLLPSSIFSTHLHSHPHHRHHQRPPFSTSSRARLVYHRLPLCYCTANHLAFSTVRTTNSPTRLIISMAISSANQLTTTPTPTPAPVPHLLFRDARNIFRFTTLTAPNWYSLPTPSRSAPLQQPGAQPGNGLKIMLAVVICLAFLVGGVLVWFMVFWTKGRFLESRRKEGTGERTKLVRA